MLCIDQIQCISLYPERFRRLQRVFPRLQLAAGVRPCEMLAAERRWFSEAMLRVRPGHCGAAVAHMRAWARAGRGVTVVLEDDADVRSTDLEEHVYRVTARDPEWDVLLFGFAADAALHPACRMNDAERVSNRSIARVHWFTGMWAYALRRGRLTRRPARFDHTLEQQLCEMQPPLRVYGCVPNVVLHPGRYRLTAWGVEHCGRGAVEKSDTATTTGIA